MRFEPAVPLPVTRTYIAGGSQDIKVGDPVVLVDGLVSKASASSTNLLGVSASNVTTGSGETAAINVWVADDRNEFYGKCSGAPTIDILGTAVDLEIGESGEPLVDEDSNSVGHLLIVGIHPKDNWGKSGAVVRFKINPSISQFTK